MNPAVLHRSLMFTAAFCAGSLSLPAEEAPGAAVAPERSYVAFLGLDVRVQNMGKDCPVVSYQDPQLAVQRGTELVTIPAREAQYALSVEPKLGRTNVSVTNLHADATFNPNSDPVMRGMQQQQLMDYVQTQNQDVAAINVGSADSYATGLAMAHNVPFSMVTQEMVDAAQNSANAARQDFGNSYAMPVFQSHLPGQVSSESQASADAYQVGFTLSARDPLRDGFGVVRLLVRFPDNPQHPAAVLNFFSLRNVGPEGRKFSVTQFGLPVGFTVDSYDIHIYSAGLEVPTNLSPNRMDLTVDEAHQFLILRYCHLNSDASIPVAIIPDLVPPDVKTWLAALHTDATVDLSIDRNGRVTAVNAIGGNADLSVADAAAKLREVRFYPALVKGAPVDSRGTFGLSEFAR